MRVYSTIQYSFVDADLPTVAVSLMEKGLTVDTPGKEKKIYIEMY